jgi:hypothetical protein
MKQDPTHLDFFPLTPARLRYRAARHTESRKALADKLRELRAEGAIGRLLAQDLLERCRAAIEHGVVL